MLDCDEPTVELRTRIPQSEYEKLRSRYPLAETQSELLRNAIADINQHPSKADLLSELLSEARAIRELVADGALESSET